MKADIETLLQRMISIDDFKCGSIEKPTEMVNRINKFYQSEQNSMEKIRKTWVMGDKNLRIADL